jgi:hypothetical protein
VGVEGDTNDGGGDFFILFYFFPCIKGESEMRVLVALRIIEDFNNNKKSKRHEMDHLRGVKY